MNQDRRSWKRLRQALLQVLAAAACAAVLAGAGLSTSAHAARADATLDAAVQTLQRSHQSDGLFNTGNSSSWWVSAIALNQLINYMRKTGSRAYLGDVQQAFSENVHPIADNYYDDDGWWALTWVNAYGLTGNRAYLKRAEGLHATIASKGWNPTCGGGVWESTDHTKKAAIANGLFLRLSADLYQQTRAPAYLNWARAEWSWFYGSGLILPSHRIADGVNVSGSRCSLAAVLYTYNAGPVVGGLARLYSETGQQGFLDWGSSIATATIDSDELAPGGILTETKCTGPCVLNDGESWKGAFVNNLHLLALIEGGAQSSVDRSQAALFQTFIEHNAASMQASDRRGSSYGFNWQGPYDGSDAGRQTSAVALLDAATG